MTNTKYQHNCNKKIESTHQKGLIGEEKASLFLQSINYKIIFRNFRTKEGEIDIIALDGDILVFIEVKRLLKGNIDTLECILGKIKQKRIIKTAKCFVAKYRQYNESIIRFDVLVIDMPGFEQVYHIPNAFLETV